METTILGLGFRVTSIGVQGHILPVMDVPEVA